jgi:hypothetical protein
MKLLLTLPCLIMMSGQTLANRPSRYTELLDYVQPAPDQGETRTCLFVASTGAMELIANRKHHIKQPKAWGTYDLAESFLIHAPFHGPGNMYERTVLKFNHGFGIRAIDWPFEAWQDGEINHEVWSWQDFTALPQVKLPALETINLFTYRKHATNILNHQHIEQIKQALWEHRSPVLINYVDDGYWHVALIVGYDDTLPGQCYEITETECGDRAGAFYVRDSFGVPVELRDYDWFRIQGNAAIVVKEKL